MIRLGRISLFATIKLASTKSDCKLSNIIFFILYLSLVSFSEPTPVIARLDISIVCFFVRSGIFHGSGYFIGYACLGTAKVSSRALQTKVREFSINLPDGFFTKFGLK